MKDSIDINELSRDLGIVEDILIKYLSRESDSFIDNPVIRNPLEKAEVIIYDFLSKVDSVKLEALIKEEEARLV